MTEKLDLPDSKEAAAGRQTGQWLDLDPPQDEPHQRSKTHVDSFQGEQGWFVVGASVRGRLHAHEATFREDAFRIDHMAGWNLIAVADGAGSHSLARVGSEVAVQASVTEMKERLGGSEGRSEDQVRKVLEKALQVSWQALATKAKELSAEFRDLGTTLLLLAHHPDAPWVGVAQIGDGLLAAQLEDGTIQLLGQPESGEYSGQTLFLTNHKEAELTSRVDITTLKGAVRFLLVMTDGVADDFYPPEERLPGLIKALPDILAMESPKEGLLELIKYERQGSFDDRTLVILYRPVASPSRDPLKSADTSEVTDNGSHPR